MKNNSYILRQKLDNSIISNASIVYFSITFILSLPCLNPKGIVSWCSKQQDWACTAICWCTRSGLWIHVCCLWVCCHCADQPLQGECDVIDLKGYRICASSVNVTSSQDDDGESSWEHVLWFWGCVWDVFSVELIKVHDIIKELNIICYEYATINYIIGPNS